MTKSLAPILERANITYQMRTLRKLISELEQEPKSLARDIQLDALQYELDTLVHHFVFLIVENIPKH